MQLQVLSFIYSAMAKNSKTVTYAQGNVEFLKQMFVFLPPRPIHQSPEQSIVSLEYTYDILHQPAHKIP